MIMRISKYKLAYVFLFLLLLPSLGITLGSIFIPILFFVEGLLICVFPFLYKHILSDIINLFLKTPCAFLLLFVMWATITVVMSILTGTLYLKSFIFSYIGGLLFCVISPIIISYFFNRRFIEPQQFIKFYVFICLFIFGLGLLEYIIKQINLDFANIITNIFNNKRMMLYACDATQLQRTRIKSIFDEPSNLAEFIYLNIPIIYSLSLSKFKIFSNTLINKLSKKLLLFLAFTNLILTKSPISLIFIIIISIFFFFKTIVRKIRSLLMFSLVTFVVAVFILAIALLTSDYSIFDIQETYLIRVIQTIPSLLSLDALIIVEPSLATRIINYANNLLVFKEHPLFGVGYGNMSQYILVQMETSPLPMTFELWKNLTLGIGNVASAIFYRVMAETGIIGYLLIFTFSIKTYFLNKKIIKYSDGLIRDFSIGINAYLIIFMTIVTFYNSNLHNTHYWLIFGYVFAMRFWILNRRNV